MHFFNKYPYEITDKFDEMLLKDNIRSTNLVSIGRNSLHGISFFMSVDEDFLRSILVPSLSRIHSGCSTGTWVV